MISTSSVNLAQTSSAIVTWGWVHGPSVIFIILGAIFIRIAGGILLERTIRRLVPSSHFHSREAEIQRENTLIRITRGTLNILVWVIAILMVLSQMGIDIAPLLAAAGVAGVAVGFGAQYLIRDIVSGLFIIIENQYRIGDVACLDGTCGLVEDISIRMTTLRDLDGTVYHIAHGTITKVSNMSKEYARVNLNIGVSYASNLEDVIRVLNETGKEMFDDPAWKKNMLSPIKFERVDDFADSAIMVKVLGDTKTLQQWSVAGEYRKRIKIAFDKAGIEIPFPQRVVHQVVAKKA